MKSAQAPEVAALVREGATILDVELVPQRRQAFQQAAREYVNFYLAPMRIEEVESRGDPLAGAARDPEYDPLFARMVSRTPAPFGVGPEFQGWMRS